MTYSVDGYKQTPRHKRAALNLDRFVATPLAGEVALLIDDVLTTGSQVEACRRALHKAGCGPVTIVTAAATQDKPPERCPSCKSSLIRRIRRSDGSAFFGCTNFPKCRYTRALPARTQRQSGKAKIAADSS